MALGLFEVEPQTPFSESIVWQLNRDFYHDRGISAWSDDIVPHQLTSSAQVGKTYAELIFAFLKDLSEKGQTSEVVYILELGAGHGRLAFHVLMQLKKLVASTDEVLPPFCYVLSDIVEENLAFFETHIQFQNFLESGMLDVTYFDAAKSQEMVLRYAKKTIQNHALDQPILAIANYFFDSIPNELFHVQNRVVSSCDLSIHSKENPEGKSAESMLEQLEFSFHHSVAELPIFTDPMMNEIIEEYRDSLADTYLFFPKKGMTCLNNIRSLSKEGLVLLTMDKGFHQLHNLQNKRQPEMIIHGSFSLWVNYHALSAACTKQGGKVLFPSFSNFSLEIGCLLFLEDGGSYQHTDAAYQQFVNNFGPDDFNSIKKLAYTQVAQLNMKELIALYRMSAYDSTFFIRFMPRLKQVAKRITINERHRLAQTFDCVWDMYFNINESYDLAYEIGGLLYDLGFYKKAQSYFQYSVDAFGLKGEVFYNQALCHYQLNEDDQFYKVLKEAKKTFPEFEKIKELEKLDMG